MQASPAQPSYQLNIYSILLEWKQENTKGRHQKQRKTSINYLPNLGFGSFHHQTTAYLAFYNCSLCPQTVSEIFHMSI